MSNSYPTLKMNLFELIRLGPDQTRCILIRPDKTINDSRLLRSLAIVRKLEKIILNSILSINIFNGNVLIS